MLKCKIHFLQQSIVLDLSEPPYTVQDKLQSIGILTPPNNIPLNNMMTLKAELYPEDAMGERVVYLINKDNDTLGKINKLCYCIDGMDYKSELKFGDALDSGKADTIDEAVKTAERVREYQRLRKKREQCR